MKAQNFQFFSYVPEPIPPTKWRAGQWLTPAERIIQRERFGADWAKYQKFLQDYAEIFSLWEQSEYCPDRLSREAHIQAKSNAFAASFSNGRCVIPVSEPHRRLHTYITGSAGSGKSEALKAFIWHYLTRNPSTAVVLISSESNICRQVAKFNVNLESDRLVYIQPLIDEGKHFPCLNPFDFPNKEQISVLEAEKYASDFLDFFDEILQENDDALSGKMKMVLANVLPVLIKWENADIYDLLDFLNPEFTEEKIDGVKVRTFPKAQKFIDFANIHFKSNRNLVDFLNGKFIRESSTLLTREAIYTRIYEVFSSSVMQYLFAGKSTIDFEKLVHQKKLIVFDIPKGELGEAYTKIIGKILVAKLKIFAFKNNPAFKCHLFIDECHNFLTPSMLAVLAECRKFRLHLTLAHQQIGQIPNTDHRAQILGNTGVKLIGANGDTDTLKVLAKSVGGDLAEMQKRLRRGVFLLWKTGLDNAVKPPIFISIPRNTADNKQSMNDKQWEAVKNVQIERYYRNPHSTPSPVSENPVNGKKSPNTDDVNPYLN